MGKVVSKNFSVSEGRETTNKCPRTMRGDSEAFRNRKGSLEFVSPTALSKERPSYYAVWGRELSLRFLWRVGFMRNAGFLASKLQPTGSFVAAFDFACVLHINGLGMGLGWVWVRVLDGGRLA